ncbi:CDP-diacylglycerol--glycerol-3-phosphate 3-phosphatidyltransferase [Ruminiclostridium hungatei]|uniref:CDP-diacylglycerol--glycerol-3-phosphate 3-phosphatidyltransferase n=1 Tax=Ruminiclostridium hungatei TaxID=48256 RepID=A0A1V4SE32_RUMHU|nr:CDP-alcohol phosphatidyltransferase family protein [Ruminiclostridium hungatei]OPX42118.1 CDP-diacylglycerol--glycerol-3-phosphate 3-phosphatidyltransferase [Ruminiclostridium hungatei]
MIRQIPNILSFARIVLSIALLTVQPLGNVFYLIYVICGASDILDGYMARRMGTGSKAGARLDTVADIIMAGILFVRLYPFLKLPTAIIGWILSIGAIRIASIIAVALKHKTFAMLHTYSNKFAGMLLFLIPFFLDFPTNIWMYAVCGAASLSAIEELLIQLGSAKLEPDRKSIFHRL